MGGGEATSLHVLLAEDDGELREILASALRRGGHRVTEVADGPALGAQIAAATSPGAAPIDLVITDVRMPGASGLAVLDALGAARPPFIVMTAAGDEAVRGEARRLGAIGLLDKPFLPAELSLLLEDMLPG